MERRSRNTLIIIIIIIIIIITIIIIPMSESQYSMVMKLSGVVRMGTGILRYCQGKEGGAISWQC